MEPLRIVPCVPSIFNLQQCILSGEAVGRGWREGEGFVRLGLPSRAANLLLRCWRGSVGDGANVLHCDFRVAQLLPSQPPSGGGGEGVGCWKEMDLGRHVLSRAREKMNANELNSSGFELDEDEVESSVRFNDILSCTSKDIQMLKSGTIKMMRLTVISDAPLSDFLYETNHKTRDEETVRRGPKKTSQSGRDSSKPKHQLETAEKGKETSSSRVVPTWKLLREKIRQVFQSYEIQVGCHTLVDLSECPLSAKGTRGCPSFSFVFVEEVEFRTSDCDIGKVASKTEILINVVHHISHYQRVLSQEECPNPNSPFFERNGNRVFGVENAEKVLTSLIEMQTKTGSELELDSSEDQGKCFPLMDNFYSHGLLIAGPSGSGKSLVVRETVKKLRANLLLFNLMGKTDLASVGDAWTQSFNDAMQSAAVYPTVLLIPRMHESLLIKQNKARNLTSKLLNHVCNLFDSLPKNSKLTVVATTDKPFLIPGKLRRTGRLEREVYIGAPTEEERLNILKSLSKKVPSLSKLDLNSVARITPGYVGQDLIRVAHLAVLKSYEENCKEVADAHIKYALSRILPSVLQGSLGVVGIHRATSLDHIAGLQNVKAMLIKAIVWPLRYQHAFRTMGITPPKGILLHSPPGCAKTTLVRAIAASHQTNFLSVSAAELFSSGVGDSEKIVADLFHRARMASPCILFIDELEAIVGSRQMSQKKERTTNESILSMLLTEMDGIGTTSPCVTDRTLKPDSQSFGPLVLVVAATNRIDMIDSALIRPGRFDKLIYVPPLNKAGRLELLHICAKTTPFSPVVDFEAIASMCENYTGADIVNLSREAALIALSKDMNCREVTTKDICEAQSMLSPSLKM